ncbi:hypothetical protein [Aliidiomarina haloalkalitolerans]|uniref:Uncharacterized protein n=1 Tax=Aliidiomarina haloalkalitolerans TaxID=859059 RepID=A0A432VQ28_9GAMM|nr:hypothetical protein [Aliidiomarina haloalkalitolerans]RUO18253.1 hypothetical protein CWE06_11420 [Aliidiomarina haloalkalitolerans]
MSIARRSTTKRFVRNERRRQLWRKHSRTIVDRRNKWFYLTETCALTSTPIDMADPECLDGDFE